MLRTRLAALAGVSFGILVLLAAAGPALGGSLRIAWTLVTDPDTAGYKVYYGTTPGVYTTVVDAGYTDHFKLSALPDCARYYIAVKAYDTSGNLSPDFSNIVNGLPDPRVNSVSPSSAERGQSLSVTVKGSNFSPGVGLTFSEKVNVYSTTYVSCTQANGLIGVAGDALVQADAATMTNLDSSRGTLSAAFSVLPVTYPFVTTVTPPPSTGAVPLSVQPTVSFSERMNPLTIKPGTVMILAPDGSSVPQATGSPALDVSGTVAKIVPASPLRSGTVYRLDIEGGMAGVRDAQGTPMLNTILYNSGFTTAAALATDSPAVASASPAPDASGVATDVHPSVTFTKAIDPASIHSGSIALVDGDGASVELAGGSASLDDSGTVATIIPAAALRCGAAYSIRVLGGGDGIRDLDGLSLDAPFELEPGFTTMPEDDIAAPEVATVTPAEGASAVSVNAEPVVLFTETMDPATITPANVGLLDPIGRSVPQAVGSPRLDRFGRAAKITPASPLSFGTSYRVFVLSGADAGVRDRDGDSLAQDAVQNIGFMTLPIETAGPLTVVQADPADGDVDVPDSVHPSVVFNKPIDMTSITQDTILLVGPDGMLVPQADGSPILEADARVVTLIPDSPLQPGVTYRIVALPGDDGVRDSGGVAMTEAFNQPRGFTVNRPEVSVVSVTSLLPEPGEEDVPIDVRPAVFFSEPLDPSTISPATIVLQDDEGNEVSQADGSPFVDDSGKVVTIVPASPLRRRTHYSVKVLGGTSGVTGRDGSGLGADVVQAGGFGTGRGDSDYGEDDGDRYE